MRSGRPRDKLSTPVKKNSPMKFMFAVSAATPASRPPLEKRPPGEKFFHPEICLRRGLTRGAHKSATAVRLCIAK